MAECGLGLSEDLLADGFLQAEEKIPGREDTRHLKSLRPIPSTTKARALGEGLQRNPTADTLKKLDLLFTNGDRFSQYRVSV